MPQILDQFGNPIQRQVLTEPQSARLGTVRHEFAEHPSRGLTPQKLARILQDGEQGILEDQSDLFQDMEEKDAHIFAEMSKRKRALLTLDWSLVLPKDATAKEKSQAEEVEAYFRDLADLDDIILDALDAIGHGFAALEITWDRLDGKWLPVKLEAQPQRWFMTPQQNLNALHLRTGGSDGEALWPFGWMVHRHKAKSGYLGRSGLHRVLAWPYLFKNYAVRDLAEFLEIYGLPVRIGSYEPTASAEEKLTLLRAVTQIGHNAAGIIPNTMELDFKEAAKGTQDPYELMIGWCERSESKAILGGTLTSQADGKSSTNALGNVHNEVRHDLMVSDAKQLGGTLRRDLLYAVYALNFGVTDLRRVPQWHFDTRCPEDLKLFSEALPELVGVGMKIPVKWVHDKLAVPEPRDGEPVLQVAKPEMTLPPELRAEAKPTAAMRYVAVLSNQHGEVVYPDQHAVDQAADALPAEALSDEAAKLLAPAINAVRDGATPDEVMEALVAAYPELDDNALAELLARATFVAEIWGRISGDA